MPLVMYGDVILTRDVTEHGLRAGDVGTVVECHAVLGVSEEGYSVEFFDMSGNTVAVVTLRRGAVRNFVCEAVLIFAAVADGRTPPAAAAAAV
jgi:hypothetical protein